MPLDPVPARAPGGIIVMEYTIDGDLNEHTIRQHIAPFNPEPDSGGNFLYTRAAPKTSVSEAGIKQTAIALANLWAPYYHSTASIYLKELWYNSGGIMTNINLPPESEIGFVPGTASGAFTPVVKRTFDFFSSQNMGPNHLYLMQHPGDQVATSKGLTVDGGGFDGRDALWGAYMLGPGSGIVGSDGYPLTGLGRVSLWWSHSLVNVPSGESGGGLDIFISDVRPTVDSVALWVDISSEVGPYPLQVFNPVSHLWVDVGGIGDVISG